MQDVHRQDQLQRSHPITVRFESSYLTSPQRSICKSGLCSQAAILGASHCPLSRHILVATRPSTREGLDSQVQLRLAVPPCTVSGQSESLGHLAGSAQCWSSNEQHATLKQEQN